MKRTKTKKMKSKEKLVLFVRRKLEYREQEKIRENKTVEQINKNKSNRSTSQE